MKTLLVTGGCGFIGSQFIKLLWRERPQYSVINLDLLTYAGNLENLAGPERQLNSGTYRFIRGDIADVDLTRQQIKDSPGYDPTDSR